jgi:hypothetical protein
MHIYLHIKIFHVINKDTVYGIYLYYRCVCPYGYALAPDGRHCSGTCTMYSIHYYMEQIF